MSRAAPRTVPQAVPRSRAGAFGALLLAWSAVSWAIADRDGRYSLPALLGVLAGVALVAAAVAAIADRDGGYSLPAALLPAGVAAAALLVLVAPLVWHPRYYAHGPWFPAAEALLAAAGVLAGGGALLGLVHPNATPAGRRQDAAFWTVLALATAAGVAMVRAAPAPRIDVFVLLQDSARGLWHGRDMYRQTWPAAPPHQLFAVYPYLPWTSVLLAPFRLVLGDVRYGEIAALAATAVTLRSLAGSAGRWPGAAAGLGLVPLLVVVAPKVTYATQQAWTEPLLVALLALMVWATVRRRLGLAVACLALALASKQHVALLLPLAAAWPAFGVRRMLAAAGAALALVSPWILAGPADFWHDAVSVNLGYPVLATGLDLPALALRHGHRVGFALTVAALLVAYAVAVRGVRRAGSAASFAAGCALVVLALDVTNKQSFFNHYTLATGLLAVAVAAWAGEGPAGRTGRAAWRSPRQEAAVPP